MSGYFSPQKAFNVNKAVFVADCVFLESFSSTRPAISCRNKSAKREGVAIAIQNFEKRAMINHVQPRSVHVGGNGGLRSTFAGNIALLPSDVIDFAMLPTIRDFWRETVSLLDVM